MVNERVPPQSPDAERSVLGAMMFSSEAVEQIGGLRPSDFYDPRHEMVCDAILSMHKRSLPIEPVAVGNELESRGQLARVGGLVELAEMFTNSPAVGSVPYLVAVIRDKAASRRLIEESTRNLQDAWESPDPIEDKVSRAEQRIRSVPVSEPDDATSVMSLDEFVDQPILEHDWVIPGLMARGERLVLTGAEGLGKSVLMRQFAVCAAAGIHPFTYRPIPAQTALFVDVENPTRIMVGSLGQMRDAVIRNRGPFNQQRMWIERRPQGLNLGDPAHLLWLQRLVTTVNPDLLCIGPAYKLMVGARETNDEMRASTTLTALDSIRESVNCALIVEHHAGHAVGQGGQRDMRPRGSSLWLAWPEFGFGIRAADGSKKQDRLVDCVPWRGDREEREWPSQLASGTNFMPWVDAEYA